MRTFLTLIFSLLLIPLSGIAQERGIIQLKGVVFKGDSTTPFPNVHIVNLRTRRIEVTDADGHFSFTVKRNDTLRFSSVGFKFSWLNVKSWVDSSAPGARAVIILHPADIELYPVEIKSERTHVPVYEKRYYDLQSAVRPKALGSPITFLFSKFSRTAKRQKNFILEFEKTEREKQAIERFKNLASRLYPGKTEEEIERIMYHCWLDPEFVVEALDYDLILAIRKCQEDHKRSKR